MIERNVSLDLSARLTTSLPYDIFSINCAFCSVDIMSTMMLIALLQHEKQARKLKLSLTSIEKIIKSLMTNSLSDITFFFNIPPKIKVCLIIEKLIFSKHFIISGGDLSFDIFRNYIKTLYTHIILPTSPLRFLFPATLMFGQYGDHFVFRIAHVQLILH